MNNNGITKREREVLALLAEGLTKNQISESLNIAYNTVDTHVKNIYHKLDVNCAIKAVQLATRMGLLKS